MRQRLVKLFKNPSRHTSSSVSQSSSTAATGSPLGLDVVYDCPEASLDIVAIHGLNGHRDKTWTADNGIHWLRDLLRVDLPNVRILTWGYDANTHASDRMSCQYLYDHALELVADLTRKRTLTNSTERPIIFVAHSLGGIVVKSALIHSDAARQGAQHEHRSVKTSTYGILFMGTPHQGGNGVQLGRALVDIASIFVAADDRILKHLERDSEWLQQQLGQYGPISGDFVTKFAYETYKTPTLLGHSILVVPKASAVVPGQADAEAIGIHSDHTHMVKFSSKDDGGYIKVSENLQIMARGAGETIRSRWETEARVDTARRNHVAQFSLPLNLSQVTDVPRFVAREDELRQMHEILGKGDERRTVILHGLGGMGKTQLAREYIKRHQKHFSAVIWLNARDVTSLRQSFMQAAQQIHRQYPSIIYMRNVVQDRDLDKCAEAVKQWLEEPANTRWIVVYDNYDNPKFGVTKDIHRRSNRDASGTMLADERKQTVAQDEDLTQRAFDIRPFLPSLDHGAVIITTRSGEVELGTFIRLKKLTDPERGVEILASTSYRQGVDQDEAARILTQRLDGLPLALATAGAYLKGVPSTTFADYLTSYEASWRRLQESSPQILSYEDRALYSTWNLSFAHIRDQNPASAMLLRLWAYFDNEDLWYELLREGFSSDGKEYVHGFVADKIRFDAAIRVLYNHGLVEEDASMMEWGGESQGYSMHGCVHSWTQHILNEDEDEKSIEMARVARECVGRHVPREDVREYWFTRRRLLKHADRCWMRMKTSKEEGEGDEWVYGSLGNLYADQGRLGDAEATYKRALEGYEKVLGPDHISTLDIVNNLGNLYTDQGRLENAETMYKRALEGYEKVLGPDHISTLDIINNLGNLYTNQGRLGDAEAMYKRALEGYEKAWGPDHTSTLGTVNNLGVLYAKQGRLGDAEAMYKQALEGYEKALGMEMAKTYLPALNTLESLGHLFHQLNERGEARLCFLRVRDGYQVVFGSSSDRYKRFISQLRLLQGEPSG
ncbi:hypothetical protein F4821DRAFT_141851 [Hypoxylon rubiginosum]|uniref:Uncharacterized protein n=1 Tax=Hypoxylon rubiginosum TaxID=110542 RepID=A0ACC0CZU7_9PEZI|nr:hypothetical protein F4821DRAFT_141851 [Hypoxylon rubiginosum]